MARLGMVEWVTKTGSMKRHRVTIAYTATRAAEGIARAIEHPSTVP